MRNVCRFLTVILLMLALVGEVSAQLCTSPGTGTCVTLDNGTRGSVPLGALPPITAGSFLCNPTGSTASPSACANLTTPIQRNIATLVPLLASYAHANLGGL